MRNKQKILLLECKSTAGFIFEDIEDNEIENKFPIKTQKTANGDKGENKTRIYGYVKFIKNIHKTNYKLMFS